MSESGRWNIVDHQDCVYTCPTFSQEVVARCFEYELKRLNSPECYFNSISNEFLGKRDRIVQVLKECGMKPIVPDGGYFILADYSQLGLLAIRFYNASFFSVPQPVINFDRMMKI